MTSRNPIKGRQHSRFLTESLAFIRPPPKSLALDLQCGSGRHISLLHAWGAQVIAADLNMNFLRLIQEKEPDVLPILLDATKALPFSAMAFDLIIAIHPVALNFLEAVPKLLRTDGYLIFESFGAHGGNAVALPTSGTIRLGLAPSCVPVRYIEKPTVSMPDRVTVKALFQRRASPA